MSVTPLFRFAQFEFPWALGPPDGRYLLRPQRPQRATDAVATAPTHVIVLATLGASERRRLAARRRARELAPAPAPTPVATGRATVIDVIRPLTDAAAAGSWLRDGGEPELAELLQELNRVLHAFRLVTADPYLQPVGRAQMIVARIGYGLGEQVADGRWSAARELIVPDAARFARRVKVLSPQARLAAVLGGHESALACEELVLRARLDLDHDRPREAALQLLVALDAAFAELAADPRAPELAERMGELRDQREAVAGAAQSALSGELTADERETVQLSVSRLEAALRARAVANA